MESGKIEIITMLITKESARARLNITLTLRKKPQNCRATTSCYKVTFAPLAASIKLSVVFERNFLQ
jgi:hypothetical protein